MLRFTRQAKEEEGKVVNLLMTKEEIQPRETVGTHRLYRLVLRLAESLV